MAGTVLVEWQGRQVEAANPDPIATATFDLSTPTVRRTEQAAAAVRAVGHRTSGGLEVTARLLLRAEGLASSAIEGVRAGAAEVALAEASGSDEEPDDHYDVASWVADNLAVVTDALSGSGTIDREHLWAWHRRLMRNAPRIDATHIGAWRDRLGWVGGPNPLLAAHVAVPAHAIDSLMLDLTAFCRRNDLDAVTHAAVAHAQFETIHPFADGNGRIGRILVGVLLARRLDVRYPPPVSLEIARDIGGYQSGLTLYRQGAIDVWVSWFADAVARAARRTSSVLDAVIALQQEWTAATAGLRADSAARRLLPLLPAHPVLNAAAVASLLGVSTEAGRLALDALADAGVVDEVSGTRRRRGRPSRWWAAADLLDLIGAG